MKPSDGAKFVDNMSKWPAVELGNIFCDYIERPGIYARQQLLQWKSLDDTIIIREWAC